MTRDFTTFIIPDEHMRDVDTTSNSEVGRAARFDAVASFVTQTRPKLVSVVSGFQVWIRYSPYFSHANTRYEKLIDESKK